MAVIPGDGSMPVPPDPPEQVSPTIDDITIEAVISLLKCNPRGLRLPIDELGQWFSSMNQYRQGKGADLQLWLRMNGVRSIQVNRKGQEPVYIPAAAVSITGPVPPAEYKRLVGNRHFDDGLAPRFLTVMPPASSLEISDRDTSAKLDQRMRSPWCAN